jgi:hypothetical protein
MNLMKIFFESSFAILCAFSLLCVGGCREGARSNPESLKQSFQVCVVDDISVNVHRCAWKSDSGYEVKIIILAFPGEDQVYPAVSFGIENEEPVIMIDENRIAVSSGNLIIAGRKIRQLIPADFDGLFSGDNDGVESLIKEAITEESPGGP